MKRARLDGFLLFLLGSVLFVWVGTAFECSIHASMLDFKGVYYSARCLLQHSDPYDQSELLRVYQASGQASPLDPPENRKIVALYVHLPTAFILSVPFGMLPWGPAHFLWMILTAVSFILVAYLMWDLAADLAPVASGLLMCVFLINSELLVEIGNAAGISISLCVIAVWCFVRERFAPLGVLCFAVSLAVTPHDAGLVWLYFLVAGGLYRRRALQTLAVTIIMSLPVILWVSEVAPHWMRELRTDASTMSLHGGISDPGPAGVLPGVHGALIIDLQSAISIFRDDPRIYNPAAYLISASLLLIWALAACRKRISQQSTWLALAAVAALAMLPLYHRTHDTRLLLLAFPAFAALWAEGGITAWIALLLTGAGAVFIGIIPEQLIAIYSTHLRESIHGLPGQVLSLVLLRPVPLILLIQGVFYLWAYVRHSPISEMSTGLGTFEQEPPAPALLDFSGPASALIKEGRTV